MKENYDILILNDNRAYGIKFDFHLYVIVGIMDKIGLCDSLIYNLYIVIQSYKFLVLYCNTTIGWKKKIGLYYRTSNLKIISKNYFLKNKCKR